MDLHIIAAAVVTATSIHAVMEPKNIMVKLHRYAGAVKNGSVTELPMKGIDTRPKAYALGIGVIALMTILSYFAINAVSPSVDQTLIYMIVVAAVAELLVLAQVDKYHVVIERLTQEAKK